MPYLKEEVRESLKYTARAAASAGELNFLFAQVIQEYLDQHGCSYVVLNEVVGALECCKLEVYRRIVAPYEDEKISENGDVFYVEGVTTSEEL